MNFLRVYGDFLVGFCVWKMRGVLKIVDVRTDYQSVWPWIVNSYVRQLFFIPISTFFLYGLQFFLIKITKILMINFNSVIA